LIDVARCAAGREVEDGTLRLGMTQACLGERWCLAEDPWLLQTPAMTFQQRWEQEEMAKRGSRSKGGEGSNALSGISVHELRRELERRQRTLTSLHRRRSRMLETLRSLDAQIATLGGMIGSGPDGVRRRPRNEKNLVDALYDVLKGTTMSVTQVADEVQKAGYVTTSPSFRTIVNQTLINSGKFKRVGRGLYTSK
jgi:hypothetical protein